MSITTIKLEKAKCLLKSSLPYFAASSLEQSPAFETKKDNHLTNF
jgi:hypothetical protein